MDNDLKQFYKPELSSNKSFGTTLGLIFTTVGVYLLWKDGFSISAIPTTLFFLSFILIGLAFLRPQKLKTLNILWMKFGFLVFKIINPVIMLIIFFCVVIPTALIIKLCKKDLLSLKAEPELNSYWKSRNDKEKLKEKMEMQY